MSSEDASKKGGRIRREAPFTGKYWGNDEAGVYTCSKCGTHLFSSEEKFDAGEGWPTFFKPLSDELLQFKSDAEVEGRVEVRCRKCKNNLGHFLPGDKEYYRINSLSMNFIPAKVEPSEIEVSANDDEKTWTPEVSETSEISALGPASTLVAGILAGAILGASAMYLYVQNTRAPASYILPATSTVLTSVPRSATSTSEEPTSSSVSTPLPRGAATSSEELPD